MAKAYARLAGVAALAAALALSACTPIVRNHGYVPSEEDLSFVVPGVDTRDTVAQTLGAPGTAGLIDGSGYYYVRSRWETFGPRAPKEVDRQVVAISFDDAGVVENVERFGLEDGRIVRLSARVTESSIRDTSFLRQLFGNIGRLNTGQLFDN